MIVCLAGCAPDALTPLPAGLVVVTSAGSALVDGADDVDPALDLEIRGQHALVAREVAVRLDGGQLELHPAGGGLASSVSPLPFGSAHRLEVSVGDRFSERIDFRVVGLTGAMAALHPGSAGAPVVDLVFEHPPSRPALERLLSPAALHWRDDRRLSLSWPSAALVPAALELPASLPTAHDSHLAGPLRLNLVVPAVLERVTVPAPDPPSRRLALVGYSVATAASRASVAAHVTQLDVLAPAGWRMAGDGSLGGAPDPPEVAAAQAAQVPVWPLVQNDAADTGATSELLNDGAARGRLARTVTDAVTRSGFGGIHLDIEGVRAGDRDRLTDLVAALGTALHAAGRRLAVDVIPHRADHLNRYSAGYDTRAIGRLADQVVLLAYDQHAAPADPGPVAGLDWQEQVIDGTLPGLAPAHTLLGLPLYARTWEGSSTTPGAHDDALRTALARADAAVDYEFAAATPLVRWRMESGDYGATYFDDADSLARKLALAGRRGLAGVSCWRLGFEDPAFWGRLGGR